MLKIEKYIHILNRKIFIYIYYNEDDFICTKILPTKILPTKILDITSFVHTKEVMSRVLVGRFYMKLGDFIKAKEAYDNAAS